MQSNYLLYDLMSFRWIEKNSNGFFLEQYGVCSAIAPIHKMTDLSLFSTKELLSFLAYLCACASWPAGLYRLAHMHCAIACDLHS